MPRLRSSSAIINPVGKVCTHIKNTSFYWPLLKDTSFPFIVLYIHNITVFVLSTTITRRFIYTSSLSCNAYKGGSRMSNCIYWKLRYKVYIGLLLFRTIYLWITTFCLKKSTIFLEEAYWVRSDNAVSLLTHFHKLISKIEHNTLIYLSFKRTESIWQVH